MYFLLALLVTVFMANADPDTQIEINAHFMECKHFTPPITSDQTCNYEIKTELMKYKEYSTRPIGPRWVSNCRRKLYTSIHFTQEGKIPDDDNYFIIDEVKDPNSNKRIKLLNPLVVKVRREQPQIIYSLKFLQLVNGGVREKVSQVADADKKICDSTVDLDTPDVSSNYTIPSEEGFCCSCSTAKGGKALHVTQAPPADKEAKRKLNEPPKKRETKQQQMKKKKSVDKKTTTAESQTEKSKRRGVRPDLCINPPNFFFRLDQKIVQDTKDEEQYLETCKTAEDDEDHKNHFEGEMIIDDPFDEKSNDEKGTVDDNTLILNLWEREKRKSSLPDGSLRNHIDQERLERVIARTNVNKNYGMRRRDCENDTSDTTTLHSLNYSKLWYNMYEIYEPKIMQNVQVQIFEKRSGMDCKTYWVDLTRGKTIRIGTYHPFAKDNMSTVAFSYSSPMEGGGGNASIYPFDAGSYVLLTPSVVQDDQQQYPEAEGGPREYLLVQKSEISFDGSECDKVGTSYSGFSSRSNRCDNTIGSCLKRQPLNLWTEDMINRIEGKPGKYFVENFGSIPTSQLPISEGGKGDVLALEYNGKSEFTLEIERIADMNGLIVKGINIQIQSIFTESSMPGVSTVEILVINNGLIGSGFYPHVADCSGSLSKADLPDGPTVTIPPLQRHIFRMRMEGSIHEASMECAVEIINDFGHRVASRLMLVKRGKRCLCAFYCSCSCLSASDEVLPCKTLGQEEYEAAGYTGDLRKHPLILANATFQLQWTKLFFVTITILFLIGKLKMLLGCKSQYIHDYGLEFLRGPSRCSAKHKATAPSCFHCICDCIINTLFFFLYPAKLLLVAILYCLTSQCLRKPVPEDVSVSDASSDIPVYALNIPSQHYGHQHLRPKISSSILKPSKSPKLEPRQVNGSSQSSISSQKSKSKVSISSPSQKVVKDYPKTHLQTNVSKPSIKPVSVGTYNESIKVHLPVTVSKPSVKHVSINEDNQSYTETSITISSTKSELALPESITRSASEESFTKYKKKYRHSVPANRVSYYKRELDRRRNRSKDSIDMKYERMPE